MKRTLFCGLLTACTLSLPVSAARTVPVQVDGTVLSQRGTLEQGVTYVPMRTLLNAFGGWDIWWDTAQGTAVAVSDTHRITADPSGNTVTVDGIPYEARVYVENGRTYLPLRLTATLLGGSAVWDGYFGGAAVTSPDADHDAADLYWLSRIISAESRGESADGQLAVGNVVLNRVASDAFPDSVSEVVFDRVDGVQFEPVSNGTVYQSPTAESVTAAQQALSGETALEGALYFYAPSLSQGTWIRANRTYLTTIGCHRFYL